MERPVAGRSFAVRQRPSERGYVRFQRSRRVGGLTATNASTPTLARLLLGQAWRRYATPPSISFFDRYLSDAHAAEEVSGARGTVSLREDGQASAFRGSLMRKSGYDPYVELENALTDVLTERDRFVERRIRVAVLRALTTEQDPRYQRAIEDALSVLDTPALINL